MRYFGPFQGDLIMPHLEKHGCILLGAACLAITGCAPIGSLMSPYSEKFSCKNDDHGQCIHPERAYEDAVAGITSKSDPAVSNGSRANRRQNAAAGADAYGTYRASLYRELQGLIEAPVTPMLKPARTVRTLILPYADRQRPDRLYMPRYVYSILDRPEWVVGSGLVSPPNTPASVPVLGEVLAPNTAPNDGAPQLAPTLDVRP